MAAKTRRTKKDVICRNEAEKLLKTKGKTTYVSRNEPENEPEKSFRFAPVEKRTRANPAGGADLRICGPPFLIIATVFYFKIRGWRRF